MEISENDTFGMRVLCVDDSKTQLDLFRSELESVYTVSCASNYEETIACLAASSPDLVILDMEMPKVSGLEFLDILRHTPSYANVPVIIVSGDSEPAHVKEALRRGAADYVRKPYDPEELILRINRLFRLISPPERKAEGEEGALTSAQELLVKSLSELASARDNEGTKHLVRIELYAAEMATSAAKTPRFRSEVSPSFILKVSEMAKLHDIGKVSIPEYILGKPEALTEREFEFVKKHAADGARTIDMIRLSFPDFGFLDFARDIALYHHERWDGSGYPEGRAGVAIPLAARIIAMADAFDAIQTKRPYRAAGTFDEACAAIETARGTAFDPDLVDVFKFCKARFRDIADKYRD
ncbi:MAG TPA: response regulator [Treponemataceae bacterium]|nr:response regulator [Treponemataceae bacterium]